MMLSLPVEMLAWQLMLRPPVPISFSCSVIMLFDQFDKLECSVVCVLLLLVVGRGRVELAVAAALVAAAAATDGATRRQLAKQPALWHFLMLDFECFSMMLFARVKMLVMFALCSVSMSSGCLVLTVAVAAGAAGAAGQKSGVTLTTGHSYTGYVLACIDPPVVFDCFDCSVSMCGASGVSLLAFAVSVFCVDRNKAEPGVSE